LNPPVTSVTIKSAASSWVRWFWWKPLRVYVITFLTLAPELRKLLMR